MRDQGLGPGVRVSFCPPRRTSRGGGEGPLPRAGVEGEGEEEATHPCPSTPTRGVITTLPGYVTDTVLDDVESWPTVRVPFGSTAKRVSDALDARSKEMNRRRPALVVVDGLGGWEEEDKVPGTLWVNGMEEKKKKKEEKEEEEEQEEEGILATGIGGIGGIGGSGGGVLGGFGDDEMNRRFHMRVKRITHTWCCYVNGTVDHIMTPYTGVTP